MTDSPLSYEIDPPSIPVQGPATTLLMLHGYGSHERDLLPIGHMLDPTLRVVSARAPIDLSPFGMFGGYAWFHIAQQPGGGISYDEAGAMEALELVHTFLDYLAEQAQIDPQRLLIMGFSQGAMLTHGLVLEQRVALRGAIACSGRMVDSIFTPDRDLSKRAGLPMMLTHGTQDELIPVASGRAIRDYYSKTPINVTYREYPIGHGIDENALKDMQSWIKPVLALEAGERSS